VHLDRRTVWWFAHPEVEIFALARFEEEDVVAVVHVGEFVQLIKFAFGIEFGVFAAVREERVEVVKQVTMSIFLPLAM